MELLRLELLCIRSSWEQNVEKKVTKVHWRQTKRSRDKIFFRYFVSRRDEAIVLRNKFAVFLRPLFLVWCLIKCIQCEDIWWLLQKYSLKLYFPFLVWWMALLILFNQLFFCQTMHPCHVKESSLFIFSLDFRVKKKPLKKMFKAAWDTMWTSSQPSREKNGN